MTKNNTNNNDSYTEFQLLKDELFYLATLLLQRLFAINSSNNTNNNKRAKKLTLTQTANIEKKSKTLLVVLHDYLSSSYPELSKEERILLINKTIDRVKEVTQRVTKHWC